MPVQRLQYDASRAVIRNRVRHRSQAVEVVLPVLARRERASKVHFRLIRVLLLIQSIRRRVPHIDNCALDRLARQEIRNDAVHPRPVALLIDLVGHDAAAHGQLGRVVPVKRSEDSGGCGLVDSIRREFVGYFVNEGFEAENIAEELAFVAFVVRHFSGGVHLDMVRMWCVANCRSLFTHTNSTPCIHSSTVSSFSLAKSWRCWTKPAVSCLTRGVAFGPVALMTACVKFGLNLCGVLPVTALPLVDIFACSYVRNMMMIQ
jgi:hypothetical protein